MPKRVQIALAVIVPVVLAALGWQIFRSGEPVYQGKALTVWLEQFGTNHWASRNRELDQQAEAAIRHIGSNAVPILLELMTRKESSIRLQLTSRIPNRWLNRFHITTVSEYRHKVSECRRLGAYGFVALGPDAKPAVPALIALLNDKHPDVRYVSVFALRCLGPVASDALPSLIKCLDDPEFTVQDDAVMGLGTIHQEAERVVPILIQFIEKHRTDQILYRDAIDSLRMFGAQAKPAVPTLIGLLDSREENIRSAATSALKQIDPEAAAKAGVN